MYIRKEIYPINLVFDNIKPYEMKKNNPVSQVNYDGDMIYMVSHRYWTFLTKGTSCCVCGVIGCYFAKERSLDSNRYHLNLYAVNDDGEEVLMTKDHILPKSRGGSNHLSNYQTMCTVCNSKKGNKLEGE